MTGIRRQKSTISVLLGLFGRFLALPERASKTTSKKHRKKCENQEFWAPKTLPKSIQNAFQIDVPQNLHFFIDFLLILVVFGFVRFFFEVLKT